MAHTPKQFKFEGGLDGISENQIAQHRDTLYAGYVNKLNEVEGLLEKVDRSKANATYSDLRELKKEEVFATNGVYLHEYYFGNMKRGAAEPSGKVAELLARDFGSVAKWKEDFRACGIASRGWVVLALNLEDGRLHNYLCDRHDVGGVWNCIAVLILDVYEHAYFIDYGVKRAAYLDAFSKNIDWDAASKRLEKALAIYAAYSG
ncbi:MAG: superoxide dismutase [Chloroflexi bacterium]|nr:superoxide dismutase [Chloroflexota bacterium]